MTETEQKIKALTMCLAKGETGIRFDARQPGVVVPHGHDENPALVLKFSYRYAVGDLVANEWGIRQTLSFNGMNFKVAVPWAAIYAAMSKPLGTYFEWSVPEAPAAPATPRFRGLRLVN